MKLTRTHDRTWWGACICAVQILLLTSLCTGAAADLKRWTQVEVAERYSFRGEVTEDEDLSGIAFISDRFGLIGADEAREVQVVELLRKDKALRVIDTVSLARSGDEIDIEGIAAEGEYYYTTGSHGLSKKRGEHEGNRYGIFRLKVDPATGRPGIIPSVERASLADVLRADPLLGRYFGMPLQERGVNIEGLAVRDGRLFVGLRGPNLQGHAFVLELRADDLFGRKVRPMTALHRLQLGPGLGIRAISAARTGFLLIAGNSASEPSDRFTQSVDYNEDREFILFAWDGRGPEVHRIGPLPDVPGKAEAMAILVEAEDHVTALVLFDGPKRGRPTVYRIH